MSAIQVKSAARALAILELFQRERGPLSSLTVAATFDWPLPSTHALLKTLVDCGYLIFEPQRRVYFSSPRVAGLTVSIPPDFFEESPALDIMYGLSGATGLDVTLAIQSDLHVQLLCGAQGAESAAMQCSARAPERVVDCSAGLILLAGLPDKIVDRICRRINIACQDSRRIDPDAVAGRIRQIRSDGYCLIEHVSEPPFGEISMRLPATQSGKVFALTLVTRSSATPKRTNALVDIMERLIAGTANQRSRAAVAA
jgi:IclR family KDG regulon transcriptional repressor